MNSELALAFFGVLIVLYAPVWGLVLFMTFRVNQHLPTAERLSYGWPGQRLRVEYARLFPQSGLYDVVVKLSIVFATLTVLFAIWRVWDYAFH